MRIFKKTLDSFSAQEQTDTNCIEMEQCTFNLGKLSECVNNTCQCIGDSHFKNKICIKKIRNYLSH